MKPSKWQILKSFFHTRNYTERAALEAHRQKQLDRLLTNHNSRFYPHSAKLQDYPVINKRIFMQHFADINAYGISEKDALSVALKAEESRDFSPVFQTTSGKEITVGLSSGTSGNRGIFLVSPEESALWAGYMLKRMLPRPYLARHSIAFFLRANSNLYTAVKSPLIRFDFYDLLEALDAHIPRLNAQKPTILIAPAQVLQQLARHPDLAIYPKKIISVAEVLEPQVKIRIEQRFGTPVHQIYQCTEGFLAHTCAYGNLHLNEDMVYIEKDWIDRESGRFAPIITDFNRKSQPVIRYRLDDVLIANDAPCPCGSAFARISAIEGRCDDILDARTANGEPYALYADFIRRAMISDNLIQEYRVEQHGKALHIFLTPDTEQTRAAATRNLDRLWQTLQLRPFDYVFQTEQTRPLHQKRRRVTKISPYGENP